MAARKSGRKRPASKAAKAADRARKARQRGERGRALFMRESARAYADLAGRARNPGKRRQLAGTAAALGRRGRTG